MLDPRLQSDTLTAYEGTQLPSLKAHSGEALKKNNLEGGQSRNRKVGDHAVITSGTDSDCD